MTDHQQLEELKQLFQDKFSNQKLEPLSPPETLRYSQLRSLAQKTHEEAQLARFQAVTRTEMKPIDKLVLEFLKDGEVRVSELHSRLEGYSTDQRLESFLFLIDKGLITKTQTGFKLAIPTPLHQIEKSLKNAFSTLEQARNLMQSSQLDNKYSHLYQCITDAAQAASEAIAHINDAPDN